MCIRDSDQPAVADDGPGRAQLRVDLGGVVGVVVVDEHATGLALELEAAAHSAERREPVEQFLQRCPEFQPGEQRGDGVARHVLARHGDLHVDPLPVEFDGGDARPVLGPVVDDARVAGLTGGVPVAADAEPARGCLLYTSDAADE